MSDKNIGLLTRDKPLVSIIMPAYNCASTISISIQSVLAQSYENWELLIVDDGSTDHLQDIINKYADTRIHYFRQPANLGVAQARNRGMQEAKGRFIAFLDSDDAWSPVKLEIQISYMLKNQFAFTYTWYQQFHDDLDHLGRVVQTKPWVDYRRLLCGNDIGCLTVVIDRSKIKDIIMPQERHQDYITWLNILKQGGKAYSIPKVLAYYRESDHSLTGNKFKSLLWTWDVYRKSQRLSFIKSLYCLFFYIYYGIQKHH